MITTNLYFNYLMDRQNLSNEELPNEIEANYKRAKDLYDKALSELIEDIENSKFTSDNKELMDFINMITTNFESLRKDKRNYDLQTAISQMKLMKFINDPKYLQLMSKYSNLSDNLNNLNTYEDRLGLPLTYKPEILNIIEKLYLNTLDNNNSPNNFNQNNNSNQNRFLNSRGSNSHYRGSNSGSRKSYNFKSNTSGFSNNRSGFSNNYDTENNEEETSFFDNILDPFLNIFNSSVDDEDEFYEDDIAFREDTAEQISVDFDDSDDEENNSKLIKLDKDSDTD